MRSVMSQACIPGELRLIQKNAHQFGNGQRRMRVVHLDRHAVRQRRPVGVVLAKAGDDVLQRTTHHEVLLQEPQRSAGFGGIVGIEHARERFGGDVLNDGAGEVAVRKLGKVERFGGRRRPQPQAC